MSKDLALSASAAAANREAGDERLKAAKDRRRQ
jgi:hypothetical protein